MNITNLTVNLTSSEITELAKEQLALQFNRANPGMVSPHDITINAPDRKFIDFDLSAPLPLSVAQIIWQNPHNKIAAIKEARAVFGWGLKEAKDYVEHVIDRVLGQRGL
jgi:ribosomal protein L7/L12